MKNYSSTSYKRKHRKGNIYYFPKETHPETTKRMSENNLTEEKNKLANERRHWLACQKILKTYARLKKYRIGYISHREIAKAARSATHTVKQALQYSFEFVSLQVTRAFEIGIKVFSTNLNILSSRNCFQEAKETKTELSSVSRLRSLQERCLRIAAHESSAREKTVPVVKQEYDRREDEKQLALAFQQQIEKEKGSKGDGRSIKMSRKQMKAYLNQDTAPGAWKEAKYNMHKVFDYFKREKQRA